MQIHLGHESIGVLDIDFESQDGENLVFLGNKPNGRSKGYIPEKRLGEVVAIMDRNNITPDQLPGLVGISENKSMQTLDGLGVDELELKTYTMFMAPYWAIQGILAKESIGVAGAAQRIGLAMDQLKKLAELDSRIRTEHYSLA